MRYRTPARLAHTTILPEGDGPGASDLRVYLRPLPGGQTLELVGVGALIWTLASLGSVDVVGDVSQEVGVAAEDIRADVDAYLVVLVADGLLQVSEKS